MRELTLVCKFATRIWFQKKNLFCFPRFLKKVYSLAFQLVLHLICRYCLLGNANIVRHDTGIEILRWCETSVKTAHFAIKEKLKESAVIKMAKSRWQQGWETSVWRLENWQMMAGFVVQLKSMESVLFVLFDLILYVPSTIFQLNRDGPSWVEPVLSYDKCILLKDHNTVTPVRLEPAAPWSWVKHSRLPLSHCAPMESVPNCSL